MPSEISRRTLFSVAGTVVGVLGTAGLAGCYPPPPPPPPPPPRGAPPGYPEAGPPPGYGNEQQGPPPGYEEQGPPPGYEEGGPPPGSQGGYGPSGGYGAPAYGKEPKRVAMYQDHPNGRHHCGACEHFRAPDHCEIVHGRISPDGWCRHFRRRA
jgi:hypothetical protein